MIETVTEDTRYLAWVGFNTPNKIQLQEYSKSSGLDSVKYNTAGVQPPVQEPERQLPHGLLEPEQPAVVCQPELVEQR